jgi:hypothetical protein
MFSASSSELILLHLFLGGTCSVVFLEISFMSLYGGASMLFITGQLGADGLCILIWLAYLVL